jgi:putative spermidine/putrescine transport system permease protein
MTVRAKDVSKSVAIFIHAFNASNILERPPPGLTLEWFPKTIESPSVHEALLTSLKAGLAATAIAIVLGTLASLAVARYRFFGRETISFPGARPPGPAGSDRRPRHLLHRRLQQRRRPPAPRPTSYEEASADLGAHTWQTFRFVTLPSLRTVLAAGSLLAFALSFDEIIVTTFTIGAGEETLPIWIFSRLFAPTNCRSLTPSPSSSC